MTGIVATDPSACRYHNKQDGDCPDKDRLQRQDSLRCWSDRVLTDYFDDTLSIRPDDLALAGYINSSYSVFSLSFAELNNRVT